MLLTPPSLDHVCDLEVELGPVRELGQGRGAERRIIPILGGRVHGPRLSGRVLDIGADWQSVYDDGLALLDTRYALETDDHAIIEIVNVGYRFGPAEVLAALARGEDVPPDAYSMRTQARMETGDPRYAWVNRTLFVGSGARHASAVTVSLFAIG
ncbi:MAG: DUF3237 domain-containing protein [Alphaproteobacteria bacterium]